jgi:hypothetical protein
MKTIFDKKTNLVISVEDDFIENELFGTTELLCIDNFILTKFNPNTNEFYEGATKEEIAEINNQKIEELNKMQFEELSKTDWAYIRDRELGVEIPVEIVNERKAIREKFHNLKNNIVL